MYLEAGSSIGEYTLVRRLGRGATGLVYQAVDPEGKPVALKMMLAEVAADDGARERVLLEANALIPLRHRNLVTTFACGMHDGAPYLVMELLTGTTLRDRLRLPDRLSVTASLEIIIQLCDGLQFAHERGIVHRDIKPANTWLMPNGGVKILDFGLAHFSGSNLTQAGDVLGSAGYMPPEQLSGLAIDGRADVFAAGVMLFELLAGRRPFEGDNVAALMEAVFHLPTPPLAALVPGLADEVCQAVESALKKDPADRYENAADFASDLRLARHAANRPSSVAVTGVPALSAEPSPEDAATILLPRGSNLEASSSGETVAVASHRSPLVFRPAGESSSASASAPIGVRPAQAAELVRSRLALLRPPADRRIYAGAAVGLLVLVLAGVFVWRGSRPPATPAFSVTLKSTPAGARIEADGKDTGYRTPATLAMQERPGRLRLLLTGYETADVQASDTPGTIKLRRLLTVSSEPPGAAVAVDGQNTGLKTPAVLPVSEPATASIELTLSDKVRQTIPLSDAILASGELHVDLTRRVAGRQGPPDKAPAAVQPVALPGGVKVAVHLSGGYPFSVEGCGPSLPAAIEHDFEAETPCILRLRAPQYFMNIAWPVTAASGRVELVAPQLARIELRSRHEKCTIVVGGRAVGVPPVDIEIASGTYRVEVQCDDRVYVIRDLAIEPGRSTRRIDDLLQ